MFHDDRLFALHLATPLFLRVRLSKVVLFFITYAAFILFYRCLVKPFFFLSFIGYMTDLYFLCTSFQRTTMHVENWGTVPYAEAWERQEKLFEDLVEAKLNGRPYTNRIVFVEHPHVYTLGKSGKATNLLLNEAQLEAVGAQLFRTDRGGDITYHGPGQLVCYPILDLEEFSLGLKAYICRLEEAVIRVCASYGIKTQRVSGATGVWLDVGAPRERKICAIGVRSSHFVTMHGLALNVNTDLRYFRHIHPCGFVNKGVTSLAEELGYEIPVEEVRLRLQSALSGLLKIIAPNLSPKSSQSVSTSPFRML